MTHLVVGYPSLEVNRAVIRQMAAHGVDCIELQIPFSEPIADGPVILRASQESLRHGTRVEDCFRFGQEMAREYPDICFLFMTYYNIVFKYGEQNFLHRTRDIGFLGTIIPDLPPEEGQEYLKTSKKLGLAPILFFTPTSSDKRMREVAGQGQGFMYCVARRGVTGGQTAFDSSLDQYLERCRRATDLPLAVGFGISSREDVALLTGKADMAVIGTATIRLVDQEGAEATGPFVAGLLASR
ncbi:tryptophan synthase subunit alpha [Desulfobulbus alkaliphilus]|uniref:tryptophan synthase subunit alpha n=1 Tax=Desulfobulbus alkaliphilus TaxID=869814 RepID=UPI001F052B13|nr:tryptophan synthase subunit alpha [Desulfobulbus alkaliphilus]